MSREDRLYISYHPLDIEFASQLSADLSNFGLPIAMAQLDALDGLEHNAADVLTNSLCVISVISPEYAQATFAQDELQAAHALELPIIAVVARATNGKQQKAGAAPVEYLLDFTSWRDERDYRTRLDRLYSTIKARVELPDLTPVPAETRYLTSLRARIIARMGIVEALPLAEDKYSQPEVRLVSRTAALWGTLAPLSFTPQGEDAITIGVQSIADVLEQHGRVFVLGAPGSGKTTVLERLALDLATARLNTPEDAQTLPSLPLLLSLADWDDQLSAEDFVRASWSLAGDPVELANAGRVVLLLDGLSETGLNGGERARKLADYFASDYAPQYVLVSCRSDHAAHFALDLPRVEVGPLDDTRVQRLCEALLGEKAAEFLEIIEEPALNQLSRNPSQLTALIAFYKDNPNADLPSNVGLLYKRYFTFLWLLKRYSSTAISLPFTEVQTALSALALHMLDQDMATSLPRKDALSILPYEQYLREARDAGLLDVRGDMVRFTSRLVQEFFAACALKPLDLATRLTNAQIDDEGRRIGTRWDQVVIYLAGMSPSPDSVVREVSEIDPYLAGLCLASGAYVTGSINDGIGASLMISSQGKGKRERVAAAKALNALGRSGNIKGLLENMRSGSWRSRKIASQALQEGGARLPRRLLDELQDWDFSPNNNDHIAQVLQEVGTDAIPVLLSMLNDDNWERRRGAVWALGVIGDSAAVPTLVERLSDSDVQVRVQATHSLGVIGDPSAIPHLLQSLRDPDRNVRYGSAHNLVKLGEQSVPGLIAALNENFEEITATAASALGELGDERAVDPLIALAGHSSTLVRGAVAQALGKLGAPRAVTALTELLEDRSRLPWEEKAVCDFASESLQMIGTREASAAIEMWRRALNASPITNPRGAAPTPVTKEKNRMTEAMRSRKLRDLTELLRRTGVPWEERAEAIFQIAELETPQSETYLLHYLRKDPDGNVRQAAARALEVFFTHTTINALIEALGDEEVVDTAAQTLASFGELAIPALVSKLNETAVQEHNPNARVRQQLVIGGALDALAQIAQIDRTLLNEPRVLNAINAHTHNSVRTPFEKDTIGDAARDLLLKIHGETHHYVETIAIESEDIDTPTQELAPISTPEDIAAEQFSAEDIAAPAQLEDEVDVSTAAEEPDNLLPYLEDNMLTFEPISSGDDELVLEDLPDQLAWPGLLELIAAMDSENIEIAHRAARQFRQMAYETAKRSKETHTPNPYNTPEVVETLLGALRSPSGMTRMMAIEGLAYLNSRTATASLLELIRDATWVTRLAVVRALAEIADVGAIPAIVNCLEDYRGLIRQAACQTLGTLGSNEVVPDLIKRLDDEETYVRRSAAEALGSIGSVDAVDALIQSTRDQSRDVRWAAAVALGQIGSPAAIPALAALLNDNSRPAGEEHMINYVAAKALHNIGVPEAMRYVRHWAKKYSPPESKKKT